MSKVNIQPDELGNVIRVSKNNPEYGHVRITQDRVVFKSNGWVKRSELSTLIHGKVEDLEAIDIANKTELPGKIVVIERLDPFNSDDPDRDMKIAGDTGVICVKDDQPIYRKTFFVQNTETQDELIDHTNRDEIKEAQGVNSIAETAKNRKKVTISKEAIDEIVKSTEEEELVEEEDEEVEVESVVTEVTEEKEDTFEL